eukprot:snap_masked-scaffold5950_size4214-processed-gene-0.1 protein:Tk11947 transcript:snap_masked-scaffold5950_size4214-processed-gene-0.1-mRNA-1 annotation:"cytosol aminopeptidase"
MKFSLRSGNPAAIKTDCIVLPVTADGKLSPSGVQLDDATSNTLSKLITRGELSDGNGDTLLLQELSGCKALRTLLVRVGTESEASATDFRAALNAAAPAIRRSQHADVQSYLNESEIPDLELTDRIEAEVQILRDHAYSFDSHKSEKPKASGIKTYRIAAASVAANKQAITAASALADGIDLCRELGNTSPNVCNPKWLVTKARKMATAHAKLSVTVLDEKQMAKLGMGALMGVARGSAQLPRMIIFEYKGGAAKDKPLALVGKGVTFDSGGINIKPSAGLDEMKYDMCGAATVFGAVEAAASMGLKCNIVGVVAAAENMPSADSYRPGDVLTSLSGKTIEIKNTDAEGRLLLADALTYVGKYKPHTVIDMATLTGACIVALGHEISAVMGNDDELCQQLFSA